MPSFGGEQFYSVLQAQPFALTALMAVN